ncbi:MAG: nucleotidyltransferase family protein, partial [Candidatus Promineifilaceae bacterium]
TAEICQVLDSQRNLNLLFDNHGRCHDRTCCARNGKKPPRIVCLSDEDNCIVGELLERSRELMYEDTAYRTLSLEDQLIHLCCHNLLHHYGGFTRSLVDGAFLIDKYRDSILWDVIVERAEKSDLNLAVGSFLHQLASAWFVEVPEEVLVRSAAWTPSVNERLSAWSQRNEFLRASKKLIGLPGLKNKARFVTGQLFPDREYLAWRYEIPEDSPAIYAYTKRYLSGIESMARSVVGRPKTKKGSPDFQSDEP